MSFVLRGLCQYSHFDTHYAWATDKLSDSPRGFRNSFGDVKNGFKIILYNNPYTYAILNGSNLNPLGTKYWIIYNDTCKNNDLGSLIAENTHRLLLSFTACGLTEID